MPKRVFITAAEVSGDQHAAALIKSLKQLDPTIIVEGHGGPLMRAAGATIHQNTVTHAAMGWRGALRYFEIKKVLKWTENYFVANKPDLVIGVDSPDMNIHFARLAKARGVPMLQYVAPQLWGWREYRIKKIRPVVDMIACILPFEQEYFRKLGMNATFVGHPLFDELPPNRQAPEGARFPDRPPVIGLLPGSRASEARNNFPHMLDVARALKLVYKDARFLVPTVAATHPIVESLAIGMPRLEYAQDQFDTIVPKCDLCIVASGTATLHVASFGVPMIVVYRGSPVLWHGIGRWLIKVRTFSLVNLLAGVDKHIVPEFIPWYGSNQPVANCAIDLLKHPTKLDDQHKKLEALIQQLDKPGASMNVAKLAMGMMK
ncbi:lipid-A-disaccharide synthase [soil metagenome]